MNDGRTLVKDREKNNKVTTFHPIMFLQITRRLLIELIAEQLYKHVD